MSSVAASSGPSSSANQTKPKAATVPLWQQIPMSAMAGCIAWVPTHPWELTKNRVILSTTGLTTAGALRDMWENKSFYNGFSAGISRQVVYTAFRLGLYEPIRGICATARGASPDAATPIDRIVAGATAGMFASMLSSPVEVALVKQSNTAKGHSLSLAAAFREVHAQRGIAGFWSGCVPLVTRAAVVGVSQVSFNDQCKVWLKQYAEADKWQPRNLTAVAGIITGVFYATVTMPIEIVRVKMSASKDKTTVSKALTNFVRENGVLAIYKPFVPYASRCVVHTAVSFMILDAMKRTVLPGSA
jgi:solute carrier family 25 oxoglutarate transporter 11